MAFGILSIVIIISKKDYIHYLRTRSTFIQKGAHRLTLDEVLENENRNKIIDLIITGDFFAYPEEGIEIIEKKLMYPGYFKKSNKHIYNSISKRVTELIAKYPEDQSIFKGYLKSQEEENALLENHIACVTWLLKKKTDQS